MGKPLLRGWENGDRAFFPLQHWLSVSPEPVHHGTRGVRQSSHGGKRLCPHFPILIAGAVLLALAAWADAPLHLTFDGGLAAGPAQPLVAEGVTLVPGKAGQAAHLAAETKLAYPAPSFLKHGFDIRLWVRHDRSLSDLHFDELVYFYHETPDEHNRICLQKRAGTDYLLFSMSDGTGRAKGAEFAGNWFAMKSAPLDWQAGAWHELRITASRAKGEAALFIDGALLASAKGTEMPQAVADRFWLGSLNGRSQMLGDIDEVSIAPTGGEQ